MPRLVADTLELQDLSAGYWFEITRGGLDSSFEVRGSDTIIPGKAGRQARDRTADSMPVVLHGIVFGISGDMGESYLSRMTALKAVFDPTADPFTLTIHPDAAGVGGKLSSGQSATLNVRFLRFVGPPAAGDQVRTLDIECESIDSPPEWVIAS